MFKIFRKNCCGLDVHKTWIYACIGITDANGLTNYKEARFSSFSKGLRELADWLAKFDCMDVCMESAGRFWVPVFNVLEKTCWVTLAHPKYTKPQKGNKTDRKDAKWICNLFMCDMTKPSFIPPPDIRHLRDLVRYRVKLTNMLTGEKNRAQNCLTVSNLKLDDVFSDVFGKSARSITEHILAHPGETFDSEIGAEMSVFPTAKHLSSWAGCCPRNDSSGGKRKGSRISRAGSHIKPLLVQVANAVVRSDKHPECKERYRRLKARRGHNKAIIAICRMLLTAIWNILSKVEPYNPDGYLTDRTAEPSKVLSTSQALSLLRLKGYIIKDDLSHPPSPA
ncbi:MAG: transposase [Oscillospiraceae bacterium]|jgi:transposase|nr:transposase [Oscillospiraceae bacterium]